jgi:hypothetical protein
MSIEAMTQALEALETLNSGDSYKTHNAATALRQAIEQAEKQEPVAWMEHMPVEGENVAKSVRMTSSKVVAQMMANPIPLYKGLSEHMVQATNGQVRIDPVTGNAGIGTPPETSVQEPMHPEIKKMYENYFDKCFRESSAAQRTWVGLTDEEIQEMRLKTLDSVATNYETYKAIEAKLKEKNT